jgi:Protein of unknown function (DUF1559)
LNFKLRDIFVLTFAVAVLFALVVPAIMAAREQARMMQCSGHLKQLVLAIHNYHDTYKRLPCAMGGTDGSPLVSNAGSVSGFVGFMPFLEASPFFHDLMTGTPPGVPAGGSAPWIAGPTKTNFWDTNFPYFVCPSELTSKPKPAEYGATNYAFCWGDSVASILDIPDRLPTRGPFQARVYKRFADVKDGLSNTLAFGEIARKAPSPKHGVVAIAQGIDQDPALCVAQFEGTRFVKGTKFVKSAQRRGGRWCDGRPYYTGFTTVLSPNSLSCTTTDADGTWGIYSASSNHKGVVQVGFLDGGCRVISSSIDCGSPKTVPPDAAQRAGENLESPYGIWGAIGTIASGDAKTTFDDVH